MRPDHSSRQQGYILISVLIAISLLTTIAYTLNREGVVNTQLVIAEAQDHELNYVVEAALSHAKWQMNAMDCAGYTNIPVTPFGPHSYSVNLNQVSGSPMTVTATGQLANGVTQAVTFNDIKVYGITPITLTLQPDSTAGKDTYVRSNRANRNYGGSNRIHVERNRRNGLVEFDLSTIPVGATLVNATLELYVENDGNNPVQIDVHEITQFWVEGTLNGNGAANGATWNDYDGTNPWQTAGGDYDPTVVASTIIPTGNNVWRQWDITTLVSDWLDNTTPNNGLMLRQAPPRDRIRFASSENGNDTLNPKLTITYIGECGTGGGPPPGSTVDTILPEQDAYLNRNRVNQNRGDRDDLRVGQNDRFHTVAQFDITTVPPVIIDSALLRFYVDDVRNPIGNDIDIDVHPITETWIELQVTWRRRINGVDWITPGGTIDPIVGNFVIPNGNEGIWIELDITPLTQEWIDGVRPNDGVLLLANVPERVKLNSREKPANPPELVITYPTP